MKALCTDPAKIKAAQDSFWSYRAASEMPDNPPADSRMSQDDWQSLSPGMRRDIWRDHNRRKGV